MEDIPLLAEHFRSRARGGGAEARGISLEALEMLSRYPWPGNVRELQNVMERAAVMASSAVIGVDALPDSIIEFALAERSQPYPAGAVKPQEMEMIEGALIRFRGDKSKAARHVGWNRPKFYRRMRHYGIPYDFGHIQAEPGLARS